MELFFNMDCMEGMKNYPDNYFDLAIVDPVYGDVTKGGYMFNNVGQRYKNSKANEKAYNAALWYQPKTGKDYFTELFRVSKNQIIWGGNYFTPFLPPSQCWIVWDKRHPEGVTFADVELAWTSYDKAARIFRFLWNGMMQENQKNKEFRIHPTQKPVALYEWILEKFSDKGEIILDTHVGSGSSLIACHNKGRQYVGYEIEPVYYEAAKKRVDSANAQFTIFNYEGE